MTQDISTWRTKDKKELKKMYILQIRNMPFKGYDVSLPSGAAAFQGFSIPPNMRARGFVLWILQLRRDVKQHRTCRSWTWKPDDGFKNADMFTAVNAAVRNSW